MWKSTGQTAVRLRQNLLLTMLIKIKHPSSDDGMHVPIGSTKLAHWQHLRHAINM